MVRGLEKAAFGGGFEGGEFRRDCAQRAANAIGRGIGWICRQKQARLERLTGGAGCNHWFGVGHSSPSRPTKTFYPRIGERKANLRDFAVDEDSDDDAF